MNFQVGPESIASYKRLSYTIWHALAEFIDNSTQSYFDNRERLAAVHGREPGLEISITHDKDAGTLTIMDDSVGMDETDLEAALRVAGHPPRPTGRSRYGMGLKTAACWFGDVWELRTKKLGVETPYHVRVDVARVAAGVTDLDVRPLPPEALDRSYTHLVISHLHKKFGAKVKRDVEVYLSSMYRNDIARGDVAIYWNGTKLTWSVDDDRWLVDKEGTKYFKPISGIVGGIEVEGSVGVLAKGSRKEAGFSIFQNNRIIKGFPDNWRPELIFGQKGGTNNLLNQRLVGELNLDGFEVSHTKDSVVFDGEQEEMLEQWLRDQCATYIETARVPYRSGQGGVDDRGPSPQEAAMALSSLEAQLRSPEMADDVELFEMPSTQAVDAAVRALIAGESEATPQLEVQVGSVLVRVYAEFSGSPDTVYLAFDSADPTLLKVRVNMLHPYVSTIVGDEGLRAYFFNCVFDALAENKVLQKRGEVHPNSVRLMKDTMLKAASRIEDTTGS